MLAGGCVSHETADAFCGGGGRYEQGACVLPKCQGAQELDVSTGACVAARSMRVIAGRDHIILVRGETLTCRSDRPPLLEGGHAACVPDDALCPRGTRWATSSTTGFHCDRAPRCYAGEIADPDSGKCLRLLESRPDESGYRVDVARWARAALGADGGVGTLAFCAPFARRPSLFSLGGQSNARARFTVELRFPDDDITQVYAHLDGLDELAGRGLSDGAMALAEQSTRPMIEALRAIGGEASAGVVRTTVHCFVTTTERPFSTPIRTPAPDGGADGGIEDLDPDDSSGVSEN